MQSQNNAKNNFIRHYTSVPITIFSPLHSGQVVFRLTVVGPAGS